MSSVDITKLLEYATGRADPETEEAVRRELANPESDTSQFVRSLANAAPLGIAGLPAFDREEMRVVCEEIDDLIAGFRHVDEDGEVLPPFDLNESSGPGDMIGQDDGGQSHPSEPSPHSFRIIFAFAAVACLLMALGILIGSRIPIGRTQVLVATATPLFTPGRGVDEDWLGVEIRSDLAGFATVIALATDARPEVIPGLGGDDIPIRTGVPKKVGPLPPGTDRVLFVVTETPAGEPIRRALRSRSFGADRSAELQDYLRPILASKGYRRMAFGTTTFTQPRG